MKYHYLIIVTINIIKILIFFLNLYIYMKIKSNAQIKLYILNNPLIVWVRKLFVNYFFTSIKLSIKSLQL